MGELGHAQVDDGYEVGGRAKAHGRALGPLEKAVHGLDEGVAAVIEHPTRHGVQALLGGDGQLLEWLEPAAPRPTPPGPGALEIGALQPVHGVELRLAPTRGVAPHAPHQLLERLAVVATQRRANRLGVLAHLRTPHLVHRLVGHRDDVKPVIADLCLRKRQGRPFGVGRAHVHAHVAHLGGIATAGLEVCGEVHHRLMVSPLGGEQQTLDVEVVDNGDVVLAATQTGLVDAHGANPGKALLGTGLADVELDAPPLLLVRAAQQVCCLPHRQLAAQCQRQGLKSGGEARSRSRPWHRLGGIAAAGAGDARHIAVQPGFELEEVQVAPRTSKTVMQRLCCRATGQARKARAFAADLEIHAALAGVGFDLLHHPGQLQSQGAGKQRFNANDHHMPRMNTAPWTCGQADK